VPRADPRTHPRVWGFHAAADRYERSRPDYPTAAIRRLRRALRAGPGTTVVELGSGTGKFTRAIAPWGAARIAIEPTPGMRRVFRDVVPEVPVLDGTAEAIPLPDGFADAVVCAQAFHWFRARPALREIARVLRPGGRIGLVWNTRQHTAPFSRRITELIDRYRGDTPSTRDQRWRSAFRASDAPFGPLRRAVFSHVHRTPPRAVVDRVLSVSVIAVLPRAEQRKVAAQVRAILRSEPGTRGRSVVALPYTTEIFWARRRVR
jgi:ubiquinone/menaquinone biosynthesis C-methylase UbiE